MGANKAVMNSTVRMKIPPILGNSKWQNRLDATSDLVKLLKPGGIAYLCKNELSQKSLFLLIGPLAPKVYYKYS